MNGFTENRGNRFAKNRGTRFAENRGNRLKSDQLLEPLAHLRTFTLAYI